MMYHFFKIQYRHPYYLVRDNYTTDPSEEDPVVQSIYLLFGFLFSETLFVTIDLVQNFHSATP